MGSSQLRVSEGCSVVMVSLVFFVVLHRETGGPCRGRARCSLILWKQWDSLIIWGEFLGFPGYLIPGTPFAFLELSPSDIFFFNVPFGLARNWSRSRPESNRVGTVFSFCWEVNTFIDTFCFIVPGLLPSSVSAVEVPISVSPTTLTRGIAASAPFPPLLAFHPGSQL